MSAKRPIIIQIGFGPQIVIGFTRDPQRIHYEKKKRPTRNPTEENFWSRNSKPTSERKLKRLAELYEFDIRSITTLFNAHVDFDRKENRPIDSGARIPRAELEHLVEMKVVPEAKEYSATDLIDWCLQGKAAIDEEVLINAFIIGVASQRYDWRSALGSYACFYAVTKRNRNATIKRGIEGIPEGGQSELRDFVYFAHRRLWKPYVFHDRGDYAAFDLSRFNESEVREPDRAEQKAFRDLLSAIRKLPKSATLSELQKCVTGLVKGDKYDRIHVLEILGYCNILGSPDYEPIRKRFMNQQQRPLPDHFYSRDWRFPSCFWNGEIGLNEEAVAFWFPGYEK